MALVRKDVKLGMLAGAVLLALGAGYVTVLSVIGGPENARADGALADPLDTLIGAPDAGANPSPPSPAELALTGAGAATDVSPTVTGVSPGDATPSQSHLNVEASRGTYDASGDEWGQFLPTGPVVTNAFTTDDTEYEPGNVDLNGPDVTEAAITGDYPTDEVPSEIAGENAVANGETGTATPGVSGPSSAGDVGNPFAPGAGTPSAGDPWETATSTPRADPGTDPAAPKLPTKHTLVSGDNFSTLSVKYYGTGKFFDHIRKANPQLDPTRLQIGDVLNIPAKPDAPAKPQPATPITGKTYTVTSGDTLSSIAAAKLGRANLWKTIHELNRDILGDDPTALKIGMKLRLPE